MMIVTACKVGQKIVQSILTCSAVHSDLLLNIERCFLKRKRRWLNSIIHQISGCKGLLLFLHPWASGGPYDFNFVIRWRVQGFVCTKRVLASFLRMSRLLWGETIDYSTSTLHTLFRWIPEKAQQVWLLICGVSSCLCLLCSLPKTKYLYAVCGQNVWGDGSIRVFYLLVKNPTIAFIDLFNKTKVVIGREVGYRSLWYR